jgi:hypothetical protein
VAERFKAAVLKTANPQGFVGSNPTPSGSATIVYHRQPFPGAGPPAQIRASGNPAHGSYLGCLTANRRLGQGCRTRGFGRNSSASFAIRFHTT